MALSSQQASIDAEKEIQDNLRLPMQRNRLGTSTGQKIRSPGAGSGTTLAIKPIPSVMESLAGLLTDENGEVDRSAVQFYLTEMSKGTIAYRFGGDFGVCNNGWRRNQSLLLRLLEKLRLGCFRCS